MRSIREIIRQRPPCSIPLGYEFRRWYGKPLTLREQAILMLLEMQRVEEKRGAYLMIDDPDSSTDLKQFLAAYLHWFSNILHRSLPAVIVNGRSGIRLSTSAKMSGQIAARSVGRLRGSTFYAALLLDCDNWLSHRRPSDGFDSQLHIILDMLARGNPHNLLIIHGNTATRRRASVRVNTFARRFARAEADPAITITLRLASLMTNIAMAERAVQRKSPKQVRSVARIERPEPGPPAIFMTPCLLGIKIPIYAAAAPAA